MAINITSKRTRGVTGATGAIGDNQTQLSVELHS